MESLVTASLGIFKIRQAYFLQTIIADTENHYFSPLLPTQAHRLSQREGIEIVELEAEPEGFYLNPR